MRSFYYNKENIHAIHNIYQINILIRFSILLIEGFSHSFLNFTTSPNLKCICHFQGFRKTCWKSIDKFTIAVWNLSYPKEVHIENFLRSEDSFMTFKINPNETTWAWFLLWVMKDHWKIEFQGTSKWQPL